MIEINWNPSRKDLRVFALLWLIFFAIVAVWVYLNTRSTLAAVTIRNCNHSGRLGDYVEMAVQAGMIGLVTANGGGGG